eukprot:13786367-Alexandrium_andersonii.AAC.1
MCRKRYGRHSATDRHACPWRNRGPSSSSTAGAPFAWSAPAPPAATYGTLPLDTGYGRPNLLTRASRS